MWLIKKRQNCQKQDVPAVATNGPTIAADNSAHVSPEMSRQNQLTQYLRMCNNDKKNMCEEYNALFLAPHQSDITFWISLANSIIPIKHSCSAKMKVCLLAVLKYHNRVAGEMLNISAREGVFDQKHCNILY